MNYFLDVLKNKYAQFNGRARRSEFWYFYLVATVISLIFTGLGELASVFSIIGMIISLGLIIPQIALATRRLHDIGKSGWWQLIVFTGIGIFILLYFFVKDSDAGSNEYGPNPKTGDLDITENLVE